MLYRLKNAKLLILTVILTLIIGISAVYPPMVYAGPNTVTLDANGGKGLTVSSVNIALGSRYGQLPEPYRVNYRFDGWYTAKTDGAMITPDTVRSAEDSSTLYAHWVKKAYAENNYPNKASAQINLEVVKWNIKSKVTVTWDLTKMADIEGLSLGWQENKYTFSRYGRNCLRLYDNNGLSDNLHAKIGTAELAKPAPENMAFGINIFPTDFKYFNGSSKKTSYWFVCFKGKKTADVYTQFQIKLQTAGEKLKIQGLNVQLAIPKNFQYGKEYAAEKVNPIVFINDVTKNWIANNKSIAPQDRVVKNINLWQGPYSESDIYGDYYSNIFYKTSEKYVKIGVWGVPLNKNTQIVVKNKKLAFQGKTDTAHPVYKVAKKMIGTYSGSCSETAAIAYSRAKVGTPIFNLPIDQAKTGDRIDEPDHVGIYVGSGKSFNGSVTTHKTWFGKAPLRDSAIIRKLPYNLFRYK